jgi:AcrR family transcriptional regulator
MQEAKEKKKLILDAAETLFHKYGYSKTSLDDIAKEAGLGKGTIYYYFESKEEIFIAVVELHSCEYFSELRKCIAAEKEFAEKFSIAIRYPIRLLYEHAPILLDATKTLPSNYLHKLEKFRIENKKCMIDLLEDLFKEGIKQKVLSTMIPVDKLVNIIFDWFLLGDSNIIVQYPDEFVKKAEADYGWIVQLVLYGLIKR